MNEQSKDVIGTGFLSPNETSKILHVSRTTLRKWGDEGRIEFIRANGKGTHRRYNIKKFLQSKDVSEPARTDDPKRKIIYARVSTRKQQENLNRQIDNLRSKYPTYELVSDIGSGINFKRKGLETILEYAIRGELEEVVVSYKDRLCIFGYDHFEKLFKRLSNAKIVVLNSSSFSSDEELAEDILTVVTVFSAKINGRKRYKKVPNDAQEEKGSNSNNDEDTINSIS